MNMLTHKFLILIEVLVDIIRKDENLSYKRYVWSACKKYFAAAHSLYQPTVNLKFSLETVLRRYGYMFCPRVAKDKNHKYVKMWL